MIGIDLSANAGAVGARSTSVCVVAGARISIQWPDRISLGLGQLHPPGPRMHREESSLLPARVNVKGALTSFLHTFRFSLSLCLSLSLSLSWDKVHVTEPPGSPFCSPLSLFFPLFAFFFCLFAEDLIYALRYSFAPRAPRADRLLPLRNGKHLVDCNSDFRSAGACAPAEGLAQPRVSQPRRVADASTWRIMRPNDR